MKCKCGKEELVEARAHAVRCAQCVAREKLIEQIENAVDEFESSTGLTVLKLDGGPPRIFDKDMNREPYWCHPQIVYCDSPKGSRIK